MVSLKGPRVNDNHWLLISSSLPSHWTPLPKIALQEHLRKYLSQHRSRLWTKKISEIRGKYPIALSDFSADQSRINLKSKLISILYSRLTTYQSSFSDHQDMSTKVFVFFSEYLYFSFFSWYFYNSSGSGSFLGVSEQQLDQEKRQRQSPSQRDTFFYLSRPCKDKQKETDKDKSRITKVNRKLCLTVTLEQA